MRGGGRGEEGREGGRERENEFDVKKERGNTAGINPEKCDITRECLFREARPKVMSEQVTSA